MKLNELLVEYVDKDVSQISLDERNFINYYGERNCYYFEFTSKERLKKSFQKLWDDVDVEDFVKLIGEKLLGAIVYEQDFVPSIVLFNSMSDGSLDSDTQFPLECFNTIHQHNREIALKNSIYQIGTTFDSGDGEIGYIGDIYFNKSENEIMYTTFQKDVSDSGSYRISETDFIKLVESGKMSILNEEN